MTENRSLHIHLIAIGGTGMAPLACLLQGEGHEVTGADGPVERVDRRDIDNIRRRVVNIEKVRRELRWVPSFTLEDGLRRTHAWLGERKG